MVTSEALRPDDNADYIWSGCASALAQLLGKSFRKHRYSVCVTGD